GAHRAARGAGDAEHGGGVGLALGVVGGQLLQGVGEHGRVERVDAGVDLVDPVLLGGGVLLLDDAGDLAVGVPDDAAVAGGVVDDRREHGDGVAGPAVVGQQLFQGCAVQQRSGEGRVGMVGGSTGSALRYW